MFNQICYYIRHMSIVNLINLRIIFEISSNEIFNLLLYLIKNKNFIKNLKNNKKNIKAATTNEL